MRYQIGIIIASMFLMPGVVSGEEAAKAESEIKTVKIVLHPMAEPRPALKYKLLPEFIDLKPGNAAVFYNKLTAQDNALFYENQEMWDKALDWADSPKSKIPDETVRSMILGWTRKINEIKRASQCEYCDWQVPIREYGIETSLAEVQQTRMYARLLTPYARLQIADGQYGDAVQTLQAGYSLGRNVAKGPTLIQSLVGCAIVNMMSNQVREMIQQPEAPNLYWSLTDLPRPIIDFRPAVNAEYDFLYLIFPELQHLDSKTVLPEQWPVFLNQIVRKITQIGSRSTPSELTPAISVAMLMDKYPLAKAFLIERGWAPGDVEAMPVSEVVITAAFRQYDEIRDDSFKWMYLPYPEAIAGMKKAEKKVFDISRSGQEILPFASLLLPAVSAAKAAEARTEREIAILRLFEAIRLYSASHNGQLPEKLSDITEVPVPIDPIHGTAFIYNRIDIGNTAILEAPGGMGLSPRGFWLRYEIHIESKGK
jgi:hypothetical protein